MSDKKSSKKAPLSRIWTAVVGNLNVDYIKFEDALYEKYAVSNGITYDNLDDVRYRFDADVLGAQTSKDGNITEFDGKKYIELVSEIVGLNDDKALVYGIVHDRDISRDDDGGLVYNNGSKQYSAAEKHMHILIKFSKPVRATTVNKCTGITEHMIERGKVKGRYAFSSAMAYLIHAFDPNKHQYDAGEVIDGCDNKNTPNGKYMDYYMSHKDDWSSRLATRQRVEHKINADAVVKAVAHGEYTVTDLVESDNDDLYMTYVDNRKRIKDAREAYLERAFAKYMKKVNNGELKLETLFINGKSGMGKSELAKKVASKFSAISGLRVNTGTSSEHVLESYDGEGIIILDDLRSNAMSATEWLHLLDPSNASELSARYRNAKPMGYLIIITSVKPPHEYFSEMKTIGNEPLDQFLRRVSLNCNVVQMDDIDVGRLVKFPVTQYLKRPNYQTTIRSVEASRSMQNYGNTDPARGVTSKVGKTHEFQYGYVKCDRGNLEEVSTKLATYYAKKFGFTRNVLNAPVPDPTPNPVDADSMYPVNSNNPLLPVTQNQRADVVVTPNNTKDIVYEMHGDGTKVSEIVNMDDLF